jgi:predicted metal-dependent phosphoesterase TrpH
VADAQARKEIAFPDLPGRLTLKCDFHMHTVFSDGYVWPTVRVKEAWEQGLDAIAITDHVEYQPHAKDVPTKHERPYELAADSARQHDLLLIRGAEITRDTPPGHFNAIFLRDIKPLDTPKLEDAVQQANQHYQASQDCLQIGDWTCYGQEMDALEQALQALSAATQP